MGNVVLFIYLHQMVYRLRGIGIFIYLIEMVVTPVAATIWIMVFYYYLIFGQMLFISCVIQMARLMSVQFKY
ncbi:Uncharacterised protein [Chlamydia trachomatis]|nr:Uncharacterised protein [Chlamydia trachomatis]